MAEKTKSPLKKKKSGLGLFNTGAVDLYFLILVLILLAVGLVMLFSASYPYAYYNNDGDSLYYFRKQLMFAVSGIVIMMIVSKVKYGWFKVLTYPLLILTVILLVVVLFLPDLPDTPGFKRWLYIPGMAGSPTFQPSELAKIALVMFCAVKMEQNHKKLVEKPFAFWPYALVTLILAGLIYLENHVSGTVLILMIGIVMMYLGGTKRYWFVLGIVAIVAVVALVLIKPDILPEHAAQRITLWLDKEAEPTKGRWQTNQSLYAISSGGLFGVGLGQSKQKHLYVSEPQNDFIFSIVCEELGLFGACVIIILFVLLIARGALKAKDRFGSLLVLGVVFHIGMQVALNIGVVTDFLPNTGISLPFFSYGGTALWVLLAELGMVLSVSRSSSVKKV